MTDRPPLSEFLAELKAQHSRAPQYGFISQQALREMNYPMVDYSLKEVDLSWVTMHSWCRTYFEDRYTWTGHLFWFDRPEEAHAFKLQWIYHILRFSNVFPYAIRGIPEEHTSHFETERVLAVAMELQSKFGVHLADEFLLNGRWIGLQNSQDAMYARLLLPTHEFVDLRGYGEPIDASE